MSRKKGKTYTAEQKTKCSNIWDFRFAGYLSNEEKSYQHQTSGA